MKDVRIRMAVGVLAAAVGFGGVAAYDAASAERNRDAGVERDNDGAPRGRDPLPGPSSEAPKTASIPRTAQPVGESALVRTPKPKEQPKPKPKPKAPPVRKLPLAKKPAPKPVRPVYKTTTINGYRYCGPSPAQAQPCIDQGSLVLYYPTSVPVLGGHDYKGWYWLDDLPTGRTVKILSGKLAGTYQVYAHGSVPKKGGRYPASGAGADVALQTCEGSRIEFSFLKRVSGSKGRA